MEQRLNFRPNFNKRLLLRGSARQFRTVNFPKTRVKTLDFTNISNSVTIQNSSYSKTGYFIATVKSGNRSLVSKRLFFRKGQTRRFKDFSHISVKNEVDSVRFHVVGSINLVITLDSRAAFKIHEELPDADLQVDDRRSTSMSLSWNGKAFPGALFKVILSSDSHTIEYTTKESFLDATGLNSDTAYKVQLLKEG